MAASTVSNTPNLHGPLKCFNAATNHAFGWFMDRTLNVDDILFNNDDIGAPSTGIVFSNTMDDFSNPGRPNYFGLQPSPSNYILDGKKPLSSIGENKR